MILANKTLSEITGLRRPSAVRRWLDRQKWPYVVGADGWPRVLEAIMMERMGGKITATPAKEPKVRHWNA